MPGEHSSYRVGLTPLPRFRAGQDGRLPRTYLQVRGTTTFHAAATSSGSPRTPLGSTRQRARRSTVPWQTRDDSAQASVRGVFLLKCPHEAGSTVERRTLKCSSAGQFRELKALPCTLVQTYHENSLLANTVRDGFGKYIIIMMACACARASFNERRPSSRSFGSSSCRATC